MAVAKLDSNLSRYAEIADKTMIQINVTHRLESLLHGLCSSDAAVRNSIVFDILIVGTRERGSSGPRGTIETCAEARHQTAKVVNVIKPIAADSASTIRANAIRALGEWGDCTVLEFLIGQIKRNLGSETDAVRSAYVSAIGRIGGPAAVDALVCIASKDRSKRVRIRAVHALERLAEVGIKGAGSQLSTEATDAAESRRLSAAIRALTDIGNDPTQSDDLRFQALRAAGYLKAA